MKSGKDIRRIDLALRRKFTFSRSGHSRVFLKKPMESVEHVAIKAFLWAAYLPHYPSLEVEKKIEDRYKPDLIALSPADQTGPGRPLFWAESGQVSPEKIIHIIKTFWPLELVLARTGNAGHAKTFTQSIEHAIQKHDRRRTRLPGLNRIAEQTGGFSPQNRQVIQARRTGSLTFLFFPDNWHDYISENGELLEIEKELHWLLYG